MRGPEAKLQDKIVKWLKSKGCKVIKYQQNATTRAGIPDLIALKEGLWVMIEVKAHRNSKKRPGQQENIDWANENSLGYFVYEENWDDVKKELEEIL